MHWKNKWRKCKVHLWFHFHPPRPSILILEISICGSLWLLCLIFLGSCFSPLVKNPLDFLVGGSTWSKKSATFIQKCWRLSATSWKSFSITIFIFPFLCSDGREDKLAALEEKWIYIHATGYRTKTTARYFSDLNKDFPLKYQAQIIYSLIHPHSSFHF